MAHDDAPGNPPPPTPPAAPGRRFSGPALLTAALLLLGALTVFLVVRLGGDSGDREPERDGGRQDTASRSEDPAGQNEDAAGNEGGKERQDAAVPAPPQPLLFSPVRATVPAPCDTSSGEVVQNDDATECLALERPEAMRVERLADAEAHLGEQGAGWMVTLTLLAQDAARFGDLSQSVTDDAPPRNRIAIVLGDRLLTAPTVTHRIDGGELQITGDFTREEAQDLAAELRG